MTKYAARLRWGDNDHYFGPFTFAFRETWRHFAVLVSSQDDDDRGANLRVSAFGNTMIVALPDWLIRPYRTKVQASWDAATVERLGRDWYWNVDLRVFGFTLSDGHLSVRFGRQTHDSSTTKVWGCFLPWTQWRHVRHSLYGLNGEMFATLPDARWGTPEYELSERLKAECARVVFDFDDFDGERISAITKIEERQWEAGAGWFRWLALFKASKISRCLNICFTEETGERKGSWKGGTLGHAIEMRPDELHEEAFRRYCAENKMTFVGLSQDQAQRGR